MIGKWLIVSNRPKPTTSKKQLRLFNKVSKLYGGVELEYDFPPYYLDIALPAVQLNIEYDHRYFHKPAKDQRRDEFLKEKGWKILRFVDTIPNNQVLQESINYLLNTEEKVVRVERKVKSQVAIVKWIELN